VAAGGQRSLGGYRRRQSLIGFEPIDYFAVDEVARLDWARLEWIVGRCVAVATAGSAAANAPCIWTPSASYKSPLTH